jgi:YD repeat-containing protein
MVAVISGSGLGLFGSSASILGGNAGAGGPQTGRGTDRVYVNAATGNLIVQSQDELLASLGLDVALVRTYNSQGLLDDDNADNWRLGIQQRVHTVTGTLNTANSTVTKVFGDGRAVLYTYSVALGRYVSTEGDGAHDTLANSAGTWTWTDGSGRDTETYDSTGRLLSSRDADNNIVSYVYDANGRVREIRDASLQVTHLDYTGSNLTAIRVVSQGQTQTLTQYAYDGQNRLINVRVDLTPGDNSITDNVVYTTTYAYEGTTQRLASITQTDGTVVSFTYEQVGGVYRVKTYSTGTSGPISLAANTNALTTMEPGFVSTPYNLNTSAVTPAGWSAPMAVSNAGTLMDAQGNAYSVWHEHTVLPDNTTSLNGTLKIRRFDANTGVWSEPQTLVSGTDPIYTESMAVDPSGVATVAWLRTEAGITKLYASRYDPATGWGPAQHLDSSGPMGLGGNIDIAMRGNLIGIGYGLRTDNPVPNASDITILRTIRFNGSAWSTPITLDFEHASTVKPSSCDIDIDSTGMMLAKWGETVSAKTTTYWSRLDPGSSTWATPGVLATPPSVGRPAAAVSRWRPTALRTHRGP